MDRFMLRMSTGYVKDVYMESEILRRRIKWRVDDPVDQVMPAVDQARFVAMQDLVERGIYVDDSVLDYISKIVRATREHIAVEVGSSPRGGLSLLKVARANAAISGRDFVTPDDVKLFAKDAICHRLILKMEYEIDSRMTPQRVVEETLAGIEAPKQFTRPR
jgi:MoxR-like ATPase